MTGWSSLNGIGHQSSGGHTGSYCLHLSSGAAYAEYETQTMNGLSPGNYVQSAFVSSSGGQTFCFMDGGGSNYTRVAIPSGGWTQISLPVTVPPSGSVTIGFYTQANANQWASIDDVTLIPAYVSTAGPASPSALNLTSSVAIKISKLEFIHATRTWSQNVTITNTLGKAIPGPLTLAFDNLTATDTVIGAGTTVNTSPVGSSTLLIQSGPLDPQASVTLSVQFTRPLMKWVRYTPRLLGGPGAS